MAFGDLAVSAEENKAGADVFAIINTIKNPWVSLPNVKDGRKSFMRLTTSWGQCIVWINPWPLSHEDDYQ